MIGSGILLSPAKSAAWWARRVGSGRLAIAGMLTITARFAG